MLKNYFKVAFRNLRLFKTYSLINIIGLTLGLAACFIMLIYVTYQLSYDRNNKKLDNIYLVTCNQFTMTQFQTPFEICPKLKEELPEVDSYCRTGRLMTTIKMNGKTFAEKKGIYADPAIFDVLTLPIIKGNVSDFAKERNSVVISSSMATKYFGDSNPIGKDLNLTCGKSDYTLKVVAVMKDIPKTSTFVADFIAPIYIQQEETKSAREKFSSWTFGSVISYILLSPNTNSEQFQQKFTEFSNRNVGAGHERYNTFPLKDVYFHSSFMVNNRFPQGNISNVYIYSTAAILILFISLITFLMLSIGRATLRTKEIGIRKVIGALKRDIFMQVMVESLLTAMIALPLAIIIVQVFLPEFTEYVGLKISSEYFHTWIYLALFIIISILVGTISGSYVAFYLFKFHPIDIFRNKYIVSSNRTYFRKIMIGFQIVIFTGLILASITIYKQLLYFHNKDFGFNKEQLVFFYPEADGFNNSYRTFKNELMSNPDVVNISGGSNLPGNNSRIIMNFLIPDKTGESITTESLFVDEDFIETMQARIVSGSSFKQYNGSDSSRLCIINETAVRKFRLKNPVGTDFYKNKIIGVVKDFNTHSLHETIEPIMICNNAKNISEFVVRVRAGNMLNTIETIKEKSKKYNNGKPMEFQFWESRLDDLYIQENKFAKVFGLFTGLAVLVACLGLFGMSLFVVQNRVKEIGIRKVIGASVKNIFILTTKEFLLTAIVSSVISLPIAWYLINSWLQNFAYRISFDAWIFIMAYFGAMLIVLFTVSVQAIKAATANPVESLKYE